ncbi:hypothetical protein BH780_gp233 [Bacillus phage Eldridge]|nr:hypothetical protein BH780_gp233 [Bacillus phage Eldridge]AMB18826.1 hypothetical protein Eldridge_0236 [Bacillus phage Eldridge]
MLKTYEMYRIFDTLHYRLEDAQALEDGKDVAVKRFVVADEAPLEGEYIEPWQTLFTTKEQAEAYIREEMEA